MFFLLRWIAHTIGTVLGLALSFALAITITPIVWIAVATWRFFFPPRFVFTRPYVLDGDSLAFDGDLRVRLYGIDAPEMDHPEGRLAKAHLKALIGDGEVRMECKAKDRYGRYVARVITRDGRDLNAAMVADGYARAYTSFTRSYAGLERRARRQGAGLWGQGGLALHPELWRKAQR